MQSNLEHLSKAFSHLARRELIIRMQRRSTENIFILGANHRFSMDIKFKVLAFLHDSITSESELADLASRIWSDSCLCFRGKHWR